MKANAKNKPARKQSRKDLPSKNSKSTGTGKGKGNLSSKNVMDKNRSNQDAEEENQNLHRNKQDWQNSKEFNNQEITDGFDLDGDIRNDIEQTEVIPHAKKREPLNNDKEEENTFEEGLNEDTDAVNEQEDDKDRKKYNRF